MKKKVLLFILIVFMIFPINVNAAKKASDPITIYLFRGKGCGYCRAFLTFLNETYEEYGKYYELESYEVWNNANNSALLSEVSTFMGEEAGGVPYIIIGDKVFPGYASDYDAGIKEAITTLYETPKKERYDVFQKMNKEVNKEENPSLDFEGALADEEIELLTKSKTGTISSNSVLWSIIFTISAFIICIIYFNSKFNDLNLEINELKVEIEELKKEEEPKKAEKTKIKKKDK